MSRSKQSLKSRDEGHHVTVRHHHVCDDPRPITRLLVNTSLCGLDSSPSWQFGVRETCCTWRQRQYKYDQNLTSVDARLPRARSSREQMCTLLLLQIHSHPLVQAASATPSFPFHPPYTYATSCSCHRPLVQSGSAKRSSSSLPTASPPQIDGESRRGQNHRPPLFCGSSRTEWGRKWLCMLWKLFPVSRLRVQFSRGDGRKKKRTTRKHEVWSLFFHLVSYFLSLLLVPLPFLSHLLALFNVFLLFGLEKCRKVEKTQLGWLIWIWETDFYFDTLSENTPTTATH